MSGPRRRLVGEGREEEASCVVAERQSPGLLSRARDGAADERLLDAFDLDGEVGRVHAGAVGIEDRGGVVLLDAVGLNDEGLLELSVEARVNVLKDDAAGGVDGFGRDACRMGEDGDGPALEVWRSGTRLVEGPDLALGGERGRNDDGARLGLLQEKREGEDEVERKAHRHDDGKASSQADTFGDDGCVEHEKDPRGGCACADVRLRPWGMGGSD